MFAKRFTNSLIALSVVGLASAQERISTEDFKKGVDAGAYTMILDVRSQEEWDGGHIPGAIHIPIETFSEDNFWETMDAAGYSCNKSCATIVAHCSVGGRADTAIKKLKEMGFEGTLINGQGTDQWKAAGYELTTEDDSIEPTCVSADICEGVEEASVETTAAESDDVSSASRVFGFGAAVVAPAIVAML